MEEMLYTVNEAATLLKTNKQYVYKLIKAGLLPALKLGSLKIRKVTILNFLEKYENMDLTDVENISEIDYEGTDNAECSDFKS